MENIIIIICYITFVASIFGTIYNAKKGKLKKAFIVSNGATISMIIASIMNYVYSLHHYGPSCPMCCDIRHYDAPVARILIEFLEEYLGYIMVVIAIIIIITAMINIKKDKFGRVKKASIFSMFFAIAILVYFLSSLINGYYFDLDKLNLIILILSYYFIILNIIFLLDSKKE